MVLFSINEQDAANADNPATPHGTSSICMDGDFDGSLSTPKQVSANTQSSGFKRGSLAQVRCREEILETLDEGGTCENMPFMPEMLAYCGMIFRVSSRLTQVCTEAEKMRGISSTVTLEDLRCDGSRHGGCNRYCALFWKDAWLREPDSCDSEASGSNLLEAAAAMLPTRGPDDRYICQSTALKHATYRLHHLNPRRWYQGLLDRGLTPGKFLTYFSIPYLLKAASYIAGRDVGQLAGRQVKTPEASLDLKPGDWVQIKSKEEIAATLDYRGRNRGLYFTPQMMIFCGRSYKVKSRVERIVDEVTGKMRRLKSTVLLEDAICEGHTVCGGCPRRAYHLWREIWLRRLPQCDQPSK